MGIEHQLEVLNENFERYLNFLGVPSKDAAKQPPESSFVGLPMSEFEQAVKEHAQIVGGEYVPE